MNPAALDISNGIKNYNAWLQLAKNDIKQKFRRSLIGPFWITISMAVMITVMSLVFSLLFKQNIQKTMPYITVGIILWNYVTSTLNESSVSLCEASSFIRNLPFPLSLHIYRVVARNLIIFGFNSVIYVLVAIIFSVDISFGILRFIPAFMLLVLTLVGLSFACAIVSTRYRDVPQIISNLLLVLFYITPIFWSKSDLPENIFIIKINPIYYYFDIIRAPLLGSTSENSSYYICIVLTATSLLVSYIIFRVKFNKIPYWV